MKITIDSSLGMLKNYLDNKGYDVYKESDNILSDVYIYSSKNENFNILTNNNITNENGCLIINAEGKSLNEIEYSIKHRVYSSLF